MGYVQDLFYSGYIHIIPAGDIPPVQADGSCFFDTHALQEE